jgi:hypothetical protein
MSVALSSPFPTCRLIRCDTGKKVNPFSKVFYVELTALYRVLYKSWQPLERLLARPSGRILELKAT